MTGAGITDDGSEVTAICAIGPICPEEASAALSRSLWICQKLSESKGGPKEALTVFLDGAGEDPFDGKPFGIPDECMGIMLQDCD